jgi:hypothetical protein
VSGCRGEGPGRSKIGHRFARLTERDHAEHFVEGGEALGRFLDTVLEQRAHAGPPRRLSDGVFRGSTANQLAHLVIDLKDFVDGHSSLQAGLSAVFAPFAGDPPSVGRQPRRAANLLEHFGARRLGNRARWTRPPHEPLRHDAHKRRRDEKRLDFEIEQAGDGGWRVVGMKSAEQQMAGLRRFERDVGGSDRESR